MSPLGWLDLAIWALSMSAVTLSWHSALETARLLDKLKHEAEQTLDVSKQPQCDAKNALLTSRSATDKAVDASKKANSAATNADSAETLSKWAGEEALSSLKLANTAQAETEAQRRALKSVHIDIDLSGPLPSGEKGGSWMYGDSKDVATLYLYSLAVDSKDLDSFRFGGASSEGSREGRWDVSHETGLIDRGFPVGEDIRTLSAYRNVCVDLISDLGSVGFSIHDPLPAAIPVSVHVTVEVNGKSMQQPASFSELHVSDHLLAIGRPLYCVTLDTSLDDIYEKR